MKIFSPFYSKQPATFCAGVLRSVSLTLDNRQALVGRKKRWICVRGRYRAYHTCWRSTWHVFDVFWPSGTVINLAYAPWTCAQWVPIPRRTQNIAPFIKSGDVSMPRTWMQDTGYDAA